MATAVEGVEDAEDAEGAPGGSGPGFGDELETWLAEDPDKTFGEMVDVFEERGFAVAVVLGLGVPALPVPSGGVSHLFELLALVAAAHMVLGRRTLWLPARLRRRRLGATLANRALPYLCRKIRWLEARSRPRGAALFGQRWFIRLLGLLVIVLTGFSAIAPPFSGLDTLPAAGGMVIALAIVLEDLVVLAVGVLVGASGSVLIVTVGAAVARFLRGLF
ncbi:MAG TPA: exopolysaccharide biosynthesis protein [Acidimicrobiales bacterium]